MTNKINFMKQKRRIATIIFAVLFVLPCLTIAINQSPIVSASSYITLVQSSRASGFTIASGGTVTVTMSQTPTQGNVLILNFGLLSYNQGSIISIGEDGVSWNIQASESIQLDYNYWLDQETWSGIVGNGASTSIAVAYVGLMYDGIYAAVADIAEYYGISAAADQTASTSGTGSTTGTGTTDPTTNPNELWNAGIVSTYPSAQTGALNGFTLYDGAASVNSVISEASLSKIVSGTGQATTGTNNGFDFNSYVGVIATFPQNGEIITPTTDSYSTISPNTPQTIANGGSVTFTYSANSGYILNQVLVDGTPISLSTYPSSYTFNNVEAGHTISVTSILNPTTTSSIITTITTTSSGTTTITSGGSTITSTTSTAITTAITTTTTNLPPSQGTIQFYGPYDEQTLGDFTYFNDSAALCNVTIHYKDGSTYTFSVTVASSPYAASIVFANVEYFDYSVTDTSGSNPVIFERQYWVSAADLAAWNGQTVSFNIYFSKLQTAYTFQIRTLGGVTIPNLLRVTDNSGRPLEQVPIDVNNVATLNLVPNIIYQVSLISQTNLATTTYIFGNVATATSPIILTVSALSFPSDVLYQYPYVTIYASRPDPTDILVSYKDTKSQTISVYYVITDQYGNVVYSATEYVNSFVDDWSGAQANVTYYLSATVSGSIFGVQTYNQILAAPNSQTTPIDFSILGSYGGIDLGQLLFCLIALCCFLCFSAVNAYIGGFAGVGVCAIFWYMGWLHVTEATIVAAFCLVFMAVIAYWKQERGG